MQWLDAKLRNTTNNSELINTLSVFFKVVVIICLLIKQLLFLDSDERHQQVHSF